MSKILIPQLLNGLNLGSIYALIALGYTMVYGIAKMINFAHGDIIMVGAYTVLIAITASGLPVPVAILTGIVVCSLLGVVIEKVAYKPLRKASPLSVLITAIGVSYFLESGGLLLFGAKSRAFDSLVPLRPIHIGNYTVSGEMQMTVLVTILCMILMTLYINKTKGGSAMLAVSEDRQAAELMGIPVDRTISRTFAIGSALAAIAGILYSSTYGFIDPYMGALTGIKAFVAAVLGGIGSIPGAMLGGVLLGLIESLSASFIDSRLTNAISFSVLILVLLLKPSGLLGQNRIEKV